MALGCEESRRVAHTARVTTVLVVGNGAREHALCWGLRRSVGLSRLICAPGNAGTATVSDTLPLALDDCDGIVAAAREHAVDLVVVGPEAPLAAGLADHLRAAGIATFGPSAAAARIEASKASAKDVMRAADVRTARAEVATSLAEARRLLDRVGLPAVIKADGLAAGKGVAIVHDRADAELFLDELFVGRTLGEAADAVLIEELLVGRELSVLALCDGDRIAVLPPARDYKAALDGDAGPNTGGMGAYTWPADATPELIAHLEERVLRPTVAELARRGVPFVGTLYAGLMLTADGPRVLEFNCRFGDPETQVILPLIESDLLGLLSDAAHGRLDPARLRASSDVTCGVVLASGGYPGAYETGKPVAGLEGSALEGSSAGAASDLGALVFQAGTRREGEAVLTAGGRVLTVVGRGRDLPTARARAYAAAEAIQFDGRYMRGDIGAQDRSE